MSVIHGTDTVAACRASEPEFTAARQMQYLERQLQVAETAREALEKLAVELAAQNNALRNENSYVRFENRNLRYENAGLQNSENELRQRVRAVEYEYLASSFGRW